LTDAAEQVKQEVKILKLVAKNPYIIEFLESFSFGEDICVVTGLVRGQNLHGMIEENGPLCDSQGRLF
jgi:serine/threonine protein kinase